MPDLDAASVVRVLNRHRVQFVVIGGIAAQLHDLPVPATVDIDATPARDSKNLERLAGAFDELEAGLSSADAAGTRFPRTPVEHWAQYDNLHLMTTFGPVDIVFTPDGAPTGYAELRGRQRVRHWADEPVMVITCRRGNGPSSRPARAKDLEHLDLYDEAGNDAGKLSPD